MLRNRGLVSYGNFDNYKYLIRLLNLIQLGREDLMNLRFKDQFISERPGSRKF
jgi:hypothetical protein